MKHSIRFPLWFLLVSLVVAGCGGGVDSDIDEGWDNIGHWSPELATRLAAHAGNPSVQKLILEELYLKGRGLSTNSPRSPVVEILGKAIAAHPPNESERLSKVVVTYVVTGGQESARTWLSDYETNTFVRSSLQELLENVIHSTSESLWPDPVDLAIAELKTLAVKADDTWIGIVLTTALFTPESKEAASASTKGSWTSNSDRNSPEARWPRTIDREPTAQAVVKRMAPRIIDALRIFVSLVHESREG